MPDQGSAQWADAPIVVGCTGGSGSRVISQILRELGVFMGDECNKADDAIPFCEFDWRWGRYIMLASGAHTPKGQALQVARPLLHASARRVLRRKINRHLRPSTGGRWGWKHPHSYLLLPFLQSQLPRMRFVHLVRDGLDMATSSNQRQVRRYGDLFVTQAERHLDPAVLAACFWSRANIAAYEAGQRHLGDRYVCLRFEDLCEHPLESVTMLARRLQIPASASDLQRAAALPASPATVGRGLELATGSLRWAYRAAVPALERFGYAAETAVAIDRRTLVASD